MNQKHGQKMTEKMTPKEKDDSTLGCALRVCMEKLPHNNSKGFDYREFTHHRFLWSAEHAGGQYLECVGAAEWGRR